MNRLIKFLIANKIVAFILLLALAGWGFANAPFNWDSEILPRDPVAVDAIPNLGENQQIVFTSWKGRSPQDIEDQITYPLTTALLGLPSVKTIRSSSSFGFSSIYVIFEDDVEFYWSRSRILEKLNSLPKGTLPDGVQPSLGPDATGLGQVFWYTLEGRDQNGNVTGGWNLQELRSIQDFYVKYGLSSAGGVSEVASIGGFEKEYQIDVMPEKMRQYDIDLKQIVRAVKETNQDIGAQTLEINKAEYIVRGLGQVSKVEDIEKAVVASEDFTSLTVGDVANVHLGPAPRRGILDKEGAEVVGGVVIAREGANPMQTIENVKDKIAQISSGLPSKTLDDGRESQLKIVPFYDRSKLIQETLGTLNEALALEILITILVIIIMVYNLRASLLISGLLPLAVLMVFIAMKLTNVEANIVALSGIAIAIGTMVDMGVILSENMLRHIQEDRKNKTNIPIDKVVYNATSEVSGAILTAVLTTVVSFIPVFTMTGAEGKLFRPLAFTKTSALIAALLVALFLIPPFAALIFKNKTKKSVWGYLWNSVLIILGGMACFYGIWLGLAPILFGLSGILHQRKVISAALNKKLQLVISAVSIIVLLAEYWRPLGFDRSILINFIFVALITLGVLGIFRLFEKYYPKILAWTLGHKVIFLLLPVSLLVIGVYVMQKTGREFMPALDEGTFLLMPTSMPHSGVEENKRVLQQLDMAVASIPEIETVVGKAGRAETALDPAPLSMYESIIQYKPEYKRNPNGERQKYKVDEDGFFKLKSGNLSIDGSSRFSSKTRKNSSEYGNVTNSASAKANADTLTLVNTEKLIADEDGEYYRDWRPKIQSPDDIWDEISTATQLPGVTSAPKLQPIETRLLMLQTGMRAPMGIKVQGQSLKEIEEFGLRLEKLMKEVKGVKPEAVAADRIVGKPYLLIDINRDQLKRYGISIGRVQETLKVAVGGMRISTTVEGRERYGIRVRYPRELRGSPADLKQIYIPVENGNPVPLSELADIRYEKGPQMIKSENTFNIGYVLFDKKDGFASGNVVENAKQFLRKKIDAGQLKIPEGISYDFTGNYENQQRAEKTLSLVVPLSLLIIFLILYFQFRSVSTSLMVFAGIAVAFAGGFLMIGLYNTDWFLNFSFFGENMRDLFNIKPINLSVAVWVGFIALFGIATDDGVVMATYLKQSFDKNKPENKKEIRQAVLAAGKKRVRPCLMTTATTLLALLPILTSTGRGSDIMIPMAIPSFGGMLIALITLFVVPVLFSWRKEINC